MRTRHTQMKRKGARPVRKETKTNSQYEFVPGEKTHVQHVAHVQDIEMNALKQNPSAGIKHFL